jgi:hypothetical protein
MFRREVRAAHHFVAWLALLGPDQAWQANNILPREEGGGAAGTLVVTHDRADAGIDQRCIPPGCRATRVLFRLCTRRGPARNIARRRGSAVAAAFYAGSICPALGNGTTRSSSASLRAISG